MCTEFLTHNRSTMCVHLFFAKIGWFGVIWTRNSYPPMFLSIPYKSGKYRTPMVCNGIAIPLSISLKYFTDDLRFHTWVSEELVKGVRLTIETRSQEFDYRKRHVT
ncbi:9112_t:CDS:2 [Acaulospora morrowiae]|uniref:9112_t:CDS:1 n=1 Tax=Acaulospora morrowiae TaxID=94023 RepID=A0A9N8ZU83_9GLOM|nr:9112_t:CDS:2 [Acaulospora morrowiae]